MATENKPTREVVVYDAQTDTYRTIEVEAEDWPAEEILAQAPPE